MDTEAKIEELVGKDLKGFMLVEMTEVCSVNDNGLKPRSIGFFKDPVIAAAYVAAGVDPSWHTTTQVLVLTDGTVGYVVEREEPVNLFDDEAETEKIRKKIMDKLTPE